MLHRVTLCDVLMYLRGNSIGTDNGRQTTDDRQHTINLSFYRTDGSTTVEGILSYLFTYDMSWVTDENFSAGVSRYC